MRLVFAVVLDAVSRWIDIEGKFLLLRRVLVLEQVSVHYVSRDFITGRIFAYCET